VAELVAWLTDVSRPQDGNRRKRKHLDLLHTAKAPPPAKTIKLADLIDNTRTISKYDPSFWPVYRREKEALLAVLREGDPKLWAQAANQTKRH
jgi:(p)ppGpp synthase/HD superfamily hydrolase